MTSASARVIRPEDTLSSRRRLGSLSLLECSLSRLVIYGLLENDYEFNVLIVNGLELFIHDLKTAVGRKARFLFMGNSATTTMRMYC
jgi:hypothetical protein